MKPKHYPYWIREDFLNGLYNENTENDQLYIDKVVRLFKSETRTIAAMKKVLKKWKKASEHNLTNTSINRVAWLGQAACCLSVGAPDYITKKAWWELPKEIRDRADNNAKDIIETYEKGTWCKCADKRKAEGQICF